MSGDEDWLGSLWVEEENETALESNLTLTCAARDIQGPVALPFSTAFTTSIRAIVALCYVLIALAGIILNTLVIVRVAKYKALHTPPFTVALQIIAMNLLHSLVRLFTPANPIANRWVFGEVLCIASGFFAFTTGLLRAILMVVFVIDRYLTVFWTFRYPKYQVKILVYLSVASWLLAMACFCLASLTATLSALPCGPVHTPHTVMRSVPFFPAL